MPSTTPSDIRNRRGADERRSSSRGPAETAQRTGSRATAGRDGAKEKTFLEKWVEPPLSAPKPSYQDHGAAPYGVLEHMQPLGEAPSARVKQRVRADGARKTVMGRSSAAVGLDAAETPEGSPAPPSTSTHVMEVQTQQPVIADDDNDGDYAPGVNGKKKARSTRSQAVKRKSDSASSATPVATSIKHEPVSGTKFDHGGDKLRRVVEAAKKRAIEVGKPDLAAAVNEIHQQSLTDQRLRALLEAILSQDATDQQNLEFQNYVRAAKKRLKDAKRNPRQQPAAASNGFQDKHKTQPPNSARSSLPPAPSPPAPQPPERRTSAVAEPLATLQSTEPPELAKPKISLKVKSPAKNHERHRSGKGNMSISPKKRSGSVGSDSSLTSLTSNEDDGHDMDLEGVDDSRPGTSAEANGVIGKDHAAERGSLAVPSGAAKRSSADAELDEERDRALAAKKQKLTEEIARDPEYQESYIRPPMPAPRSRAARIKEGALAPPSLRLDPNGGRSRGSRAASLDGDSPLSELSPTTSRQSTPKIAKPAPKPTFGKRAKTKQSPEKKQLGALGGMSGAGGGAGRDSPIGDDDNEELGSENNDFCSACHGSGYLLCCDGCDRSFHFSCLDPPLNEDAKELDEPWYCFICVSKRPVVAESPEKPTRGLFAPLIGGLRKRNPTNFELPQAIRDYFEGVATDRNGSFVEALNVAKNTRSRPGYSDEQPDYYKLRDGKGNLVTCYACAKTSQGKRAIVACDHCAQNWHLDCLDPPLANPPALNQNGKKVHDWMCPLHADQELRRMDMSLLSRRKIHLRRPKNAIVHETSLTRGFRNNGIIDVLDDDTDTSDSEFYDHDDGGTVYKLPAHGLKLDFIDKVKDTRVQQLRDERAYKRRRIAAAAPSALEQANFAKRPFNEKQVALQLAQFANENQDLNLGGDQVENLVGTLIAEAPSEVVAELLAAEDVEKAKSVSSAIPPSPPSSEQPDQLSEGQRKELELLQELIKRKLAGAKT